MANVGNFINQFQQFNASSVKIRQLESEDSKIKNHQIKKRDTGLSGKIKFKNVTFAYDGDRVLKNINFSANAGDTIAIVGPTGSGKSTTLYATLGELSKPNVNIVTVEEN